MKTVFPTLAGLTPNDNAADGSPRGCFQIFAERNYGGDGNGARLYRGSFDSLSWAQMYATALFTQHKANPAQAYYDGFAWVQVADVFHGEVWEMSEDTVYEWQQVEEADGQ